LRFLPTVSQSSGPRFVRHTGTAAPLPAGTVEPLRYLHEERDNEAFLLRSETYRGATILLAATIVGAEPLAGNAGSVPALGVRVVIAPGFGPVFFSEAVRQGILLVALPQDVVDGMVAWVVLNPRQTMTVDLEAQIIDIPGMGRIPFETPPRVRHRLLHGLDDLDELLQHREDTIAFRMRDREQRPWLYANAPIEPSRRGSGEPE
jgi:3-isopropylmalate/(R)-2-methylmalate dehydratase small subunit